MEALLVIVLLFLLVSPGGSLSSSGSCLHLSSNSLLSSSTIRRQHWHCHPSSSSSSSSSPTNTTSTTSCVNTIDSPLGKGSHFQLGDMTPCRVINGLWQVSGRHGYPVERDNVVSAMTRLASAGFSTFDAADVYGSSEDYLGSFRKGPRSSPVASQQHCLFFTKWIPRLEGDLTRAIVYEAIDRSLSRMRVDTIDLLQLHWPDYKDGQYYSVLHYLMHLQEIGKVRHLGLTNYDTRNLLHLLDQGAPIVSNQVSYSVLDTRPGDYMAQVCQTHGVQLLCYGTLLGGFISSDWLGQFEPSLSDKRIQSNASLRKYLPWIHLWGGWTLFQELLLRLDVIARKHSVTLSQVAMRYVLQQPAVGGIIVGHRYDYPHAHSAVPEKLQPLFTFQLDQNDLLFIREIQRRAHSRGKALMQQLGDCGGEYRLVDPDRQEEEE